MPPPGQTCRRRH